MSSESATAFERALAVSDLLARPDLAVGASIPTGGFAIAGNMPMGRAQLNSIYMDDFGRIWKEADGAVTLMKI